MKTKLIFFLLVLFLLPAFNKVEKASGNENCKLTASVFTDGSGDNRTKKKGGNYAAIPLEKLKSGQVLKITPLSGSFRYATVHARYTGGYWRTIHKGPEKEYSYDEYFKSHAADKNMTHVIVSVNGGHEKYEPVACKAEIKICSANAFMKSDLPLGKKIVLKTFKGTFLGIKGSGTTLCADATELGDGQIFTLEKLPGENKVALKSSNGFYVCAESFGLVVNRSIASTWETFTLLSFPMENKVAFKSYTGRYVTAEKGGGTYATSNAESVTDFEKFIIVRPDETPNKKDEDKSVENYNYKKIGSVYTDGTGDGRTKKKGGNYAAISADLLEYGNTLVITPVSGTYKFVTLHARYDGGYWQTIYQGPQTKFPVDEYLKSYKQESNLTHIIVSVNGGHEKYEPVECRADINIFAGSEKEKELTCRKLSAVFTDGTGDNTTKKKGGTYSAIPIDVFKDGSVLTIKPLSGTFKYAAIHGRYNGGYWKTIHKGEQKDYPFDQYIKSFKLDKNCTHIIVSVNGSHEKYEPVECTADISLCSD